MNQHIQTDLFLTLPLQLAAKIAEEADLLIQALESHPTWRITSVIPGIKFPEKTGLKILELRSRWQEAIHGLDAETVNQLVKNPDYAAIVSFMAPEIPTRCFDSDVATHTARINKAAHQRHFGLDEPASTR